VRGSGLTGDFDVNKAARIRDLAKKGKSTKEISLAVFGEYSDKTTAYVRVAKNQRNGVSYSKSETRYLIKRYGGKTVQEAVRNRAREVYADPANRAKKQEFNRRYYHRHKAEKQLETV
jgi:hypothetical protein